MSVLIRNTVYEPENKGIRTGIALHPKQNDQPTIYHVSSLW